MNVFIVNNEVELFKAFLFPLISIPHFPNNVYQKKSSLNAFNLATKRAPMESKSLMFYPFYVF